MTKEKMFIMSVVILFTILAILTYPSIGLLPIPAVSLILPYLVIGLIIIN